MSSLHSSTVASIALQVNPSGLSHPRPFTVTGPTRPSNNWLESAVKSHDTCVWSSSLRFSAMQANCEISVEVTLDGEFWLLVELVRRGLLPIVGPAVGACWRLKGALDATIDSCRPQVNCTEATDAIIRNL